MKLTKSLVILFSLIIVIWLAMGLGPWFFFKGKPDVAAQYGDAFGAANSLFSALALCFVIFTIWKQDNESASRDKQHKEMLQLQALSTLAEVQLTKWTEARNTAYSDIPIATGYHESWMRKADMHFTKLTDTTNCLENILKESGIQISESAKRDE